MNKKGSQGKKVKSGETKRRRLTGGVLKKIIENSRIGIFRTNLEGEILFCNSAFLNLVGYKSLAEAKKISLENDIYPNPQTRKKFLQKLLKKGFVQNYESVIKSRSGKEIPVLISAQVEYSSSKKIKYIDGFIEDITLLKHNEQKINKVNEHLEILNSIHAALSQTLEFDELLDKCMAVILSRFAGDLGGVLYLVQDDWLVPEAYYPDRNNQYFFPIKIGSNPEYANFSSEVYASQKEIIANDTHKKYFLKRFPSFKNDHAHSFAIFPIISGNSCIGILNLFSNETGFFDTEKVELFRSIVKQLAVYINNSGIYNKTKQLIQESKRKLEELNLSYEISTRLSAHIEFDKIINESFEILKEQGFASAKIYLMSEDEKSLNLLSYYNMHDNINPSQTIASGSLFSGAAVSEKRAIIINDSHAPEAVEKDPDFLKRERHSFASLPILFGDKCLGALTISSREPNKFKKSTIAFCDVISHQLSFVLNNAVLHSQSLKKNNELIQLYNTINRLSKHIKKDDIIQEAFSIFKELGFISGKIYRIAPDSEWLILESFFSGREGKVQDKILIGNKFSGKAASEHKPIIINDTHSEEIIAQEPEFKNDIRHSFASFPLEYNERCIGVLNLVGKEDGKFTHEIIDICVNISKQLSLLLANSEIHEKTVKRYEEVNLLYEITKRLSLHISLNEIIEECFEFFKGLGFSDGKLYLTKDTNLELFALYSNSVLIPQIPKNISEGTYFSDLAVKKGEHIIINRTHAEEMSAVFPEMKQFKEYSFGVFPIIYGDRRSGVLNLACDEPEMFSDFIVNLISNITHHLGVLINNSKLYEEVVKKNRDLRLLTELSHELNKKMNLEEGGRLISGKLEDIFEFDGFYLDLYNPIKDTLSNVINVDIINNKKEYFIGNQNFPVTSPIIRRIITLKESTLILRENENDQIHGLRTFGDEQRRALSLMYAPLFTENEILGIIAINSYKKNAYNNEDLVLLSSIANYISISLKNILLYQNLTDSENRYRTLIKNVPEAIYSFSDEGILMAVNSKTCEFLNSNESTLLGKEIINFIPKILRKVFIEEFRIVKKSADTRIFCVKTDDEKYYETTLMPISEDDRSPKYYIGVTRDVTSQKNAEENNIRTQQQLSENRRHDFIINMTRNIAHVFNNVLVNVLSRSSFAKTLVEKESIIYPHLEKIEVSSKRVGELVKQLLIFAQSGKYPTEKLDLNKIVQFFYFSKKPQLRTNIEFLLNLSESVPIVVFNRDQVIVMLDKLFTNSIESLDENGCVELSTKIVEIETQQFVGSQRIPSGKYGVFSVKDNGCGIRDDIKARFFEPFNTTKEYGRGLGLPSVFGILMNMNGYININSIEREYTIVDVYLPLTESL